MKDITKIDIRYVLPNGKYFNHHVGEMYDLTPEEIYSLRKYHNDDMNNPKIARDVKIIVKSQSVSPKTNGGYKLTREQKYSNNEWYMLKQQFKREIATMLIVGGITVTLIGGLSLLTGTKPSIHNGTPNYASTFEEPIFVIEYEDVEEILEASDGLAEKKELIKKICDIYQVNYDIAYKVIEDLTENFSSPGYLEGRVEGVSCKGEQVVAVTDEELFIYIVRIIKQDPSRWDIDCTDLYINNGYESGDNYCEQIEYVSSILGVDKYLMYAIVQSECGFCSDLFLENNNPAGIKNDYGDWWNFDTTEEGFFELGMEILKYYRWIDEPITSLDEETIAKIRDIHAPLSDGNEMWLYNVLNRMEYARNNSDELFGVEQNNGLNR